MAHSERMLFPIGYLCSVVVLLLAGKSFGENQCRVKPGGHTVLVPLQNAPNSFEPLCQPARIRVNDRAPITLRLTGVSPTEVCLPNSKPQTVTTVANPLETIINTVTGLKAFAFERASTLYSTESIESLSSLIIGTPPAPPTPGETAEQKRQRLAEEKKASEARAADEEALNLFKQLASSVIPTASTVFAKQTAWQSYYQTDLNNMAKYLSQDYRGTRYSSFQPETDPQLATVRSHLSFPIAADPQSPTSPPSEVDYASLQALADEMGTLQGRLIDSCTKPGQKCDPSLLKTVGQLVDSAKAVLLVAQDNLKSLQTAQASVVSSYTALDKVYLDFQNRLLTLHIISVANNVLTQDIVLGPDYGATDTGSVTCTTDATPSQATTDAINYSVLYQNVPALTVSTGLLTTFQRKTVIGTTPKLNQDGSFSTYFAVTDSASAQVFPMAFVNLRVLSPVLKTWPGQRENELVITNGISGGIGINPNTGTNQPEFFVGDALGFSRVYVHFGAHFGRTESLGGGFQLNTVVPTGFSGSAPINWSYHPAFSIGLSVRIAPF